MLDQRRSGILLHPTSLPGPQPVGSLGKEAFRFVDALVTAGQSIWQILPLGPTGYGDCPYSCFSAFAGNPLLIDLQALAANGDLAEKDLPEFTVSSGEANFGAAYREQWPLLQRAYENFTAAATEQRRTAFAGFCEEQQSWLNAYALFRALSDEQQNAHWQQWPEQYRRPDEATFKELLERYSDSCTWHKYLQFVFFEQWFALKHYANRKGVLIFGDLPIFVAEDSADVWNHQELFHLDEDGRPTLVAGVPPDYFSATGQLWGNPLYNWERMADEEYRWWRDRFHWNLELYDLIRVDHFRGFSASWAIPAGDRTAENGSWQTVPGGELFDRLKHDLGTLPVVAEDLGIITREVETLRDRYALPGMKILQFAFDSDAQNPYLPHQHIRRAVVYTGTHDNDTTLGWWQSLDPEIRKRVKDYLGNSCGDMPWPLIASALSSVARTTVIPMQDILSLTSTARMNTPGTTDGNWQWRMSEDQFTPEHMERLLHLSHLYGRDLCFTTEM